MKSSVETIRDLKARLYRFLDAVAERISMSFAIYEQGSEWAKLYRDAGHDTLCGFARKANPTSGRCRDEESQMARLAFETGSVQRGCCWQGTMRFVTPIEHRGKVTLAVAVCGFGVDSQAQRNDYLPQEIATALGLDDGAGDEGARVRAFPGDSAIPAPVATVVEEILIAAMRGIAEAVDSAR